MLQLIKKGNCQDLTKFSSDIYDRIKKNDFSYRRANCLDLCTQRFIISNCSCFDPEKENLFQNYTPCLTQTEQDCMFTGRKSYYGSNLFKKCRDEECPIECTSSDYSIGISMSDYPSREYVEFLKTDPNITRKYIEENETITFEKLRESLVCVKIYFKNFQYTKISESPVYTPIDLVSNIGGQLGLFIGISVLSTVEMIEILIEILFILFKKKDSVVHVSELKNEIKN
jgi:hypothetical protein